MAKITKRVKKLNSRNKKHTKVRHSKPLKYVTKKHKRKQNKKKRTHRKNHRGGVKGQAGWKGGPVTVPETQDVDIEQELYENTGYDPLPDDKKLIDIYDLQTTKDMLNDYFRRKIVTRSKRPTGITIKDLKLSDCKNILRSGTGISGAICLNIEYRRNIGSRVVGGFTQIGPVQFFEDDVKINIPQIMILNLLDLRFDASDLVEEFQGGTYKHRASLIVKRLTEEEFDDYNSVAYPPRVAVTESPAAPAAAPAAPAAPAAAVPSRFQVSISPAAPDSPPPPDSPPTTDANRLQVLRPPIPVPTPPASPPRAASATAAPSAPTAYERGRRFNFANDDPIVQYSQ